MEKELETYWSHYRCEDPNCPGKRHSRRGEAFRDGLWTELLDGGRKKPILRPDGQADNR